MSLLNGIQETCGTNLDGTSAQMFLMLINALMAYQCSLGRKDYYPPNSADKLKDGEQFDFIIVGTGSAGSVVTSKLLENPNWKILVLEAGDYPSATTEVPALFLNLQLSQEDWQYKTEKSATACKGFEGEQCSWPRGKVLGGSSSINANIYTRGSAADYDTWEALGNKGWSYNDVEKHFKELENVRSDEFQTSNIYGKNGYLNLSWYDNGQPITKSILETAKMLGSPTSTLEVDPRKPLGYYQLLTTIHQGLRMNAAKSFLGQAIYKDNLSLATKAFVKKVWIDPKPLEARGVEVLLNNKTMTFLAKNEVILCAGSLNTPEILLHSGIGPEEDLTSVGINVLKHLPGVGRNLQDHVIVPLFFKFNRNAYVERLETARLDQLYEYFKARKGPLGKVDIINLNAFINTRNDSLYPNVQIMHVGFQYKDRSLLAQYTKGFGLKNEIENELLAQTNDDTLISLQPILLTPKSTGKIRLKSNNAFDKPEVHSGYFSDADGDDVKVALDAIRYTQKFVETPPMKQYNPRQVLLPLPACTHDKGSDEYWTCYMQHVGNTLYHQVGTAKMGPSSDKMAVVDERLRVHGVGKLRVIDASIMPKITRGNTNAPSLMIGHKGGEMILEDWKFKWQRTIDEL